MKWGDGPQELWGSEAGGCRGHETLTPRKWLPGSNRVYGARGLTARSLLPYCLRLYSGDESAPTAGDGRD